MAQPAPQPARPPAGARLMAPALLLTALALCYMPALTATYGYADDLPQLLESHQRGKWVLTAWNQAARPVGGWLTEWSFHAAGSIAGLAYLRAAALVLLLLLALAIYRHLLPFVREPVLAALAAAFVCTVTSVQVNVGWASMWPYMVPPVLSYAAYHAILRGAEGTLSHRATWWLAALLLLYVSLNIYPPSTMFLWFWFGTDAVLADSQSSRLLRRFLLFLAIFGAASVLYYGIYRELGYHHARGQLAPDVVKKLEWFIQMVVPAASRLQWFDCASGWLPLSVWVLIAAGVLLLQRASPVNLALKVVLCAAVVFLSYLPLLAVKEFYAPFRSQLVVASYIGVLVFLGILQIMVRMKAPVRIRYLVLCALVGAGLVKAHVTLVRHVVLPQAFDYVFLRGTLTSALGAQKKVLIIEGRLAPQWDRYELGLVTSVMPDEYHMLSALARLIVREAGYGPDAVTKDRLWALPRGAPLPPGDDTIIIDTQPVANMLLE